MNETEKDARLNGTSEGVDRICEEFHTVLVVCLDEETGEHFVGYGLAEEFYDSSDMVGRA